VSEPIDRDAFAARMVDWINRTFAPAGVTVDADTPLFAHGIINSIGILKLIAWTEHATAQRIADTSIRMDNFRTVRRIAEVFATSRFEMGGSNVVA
jgi:Phosphopantetheine attachment site